MLRWALQQALLQEPDSMIVDAVLDSLLEAPVERSRKVRKRLISSRATAATRPERLEDSREH